MHAFTGLLFCSCAVLISAAPEYLRSYHSHYSSSGADDTPKEYQNMDQQVQQAIQRTMERSQSSSGQYRSGYSSGYHTPSPYGYPYGHDSEDDGQHTEDLGPQSFGSPSQGSRYSSNIDEDIGQQKQISGYGSSGYTQGSSGSSGYSRRNYNSHGSSGYGGTSYSSNMNRGDEHEDNLGQQRAVLGYSAGSSSYGPRGTGGSRDIVRQGSSGYSGYSSNIGDERDDSLGSHREDLGHMSSSSGYTSRGSAPSGYSHTIEHHDEEDDTQQKEMLGHNADGSVNSYNSGSGYSHHSGSLDKQGGGFGIQSGSFTRGSENYGSSSTYGSAVSQSGREQESVGQHKEENLHSTVATTGYGSQTTGGYIGRGANQNPGYVRLSTILNSQSNQGSLSTITQNGQQTADSEELGQQVQTAIFSNTDKSQSETSSSSHAVLSNKHEETVVIGNTVNGNPKISTGRPESVTHEVNTDDLARENGAKLSDGKSLSEQTKEESVIEDSEKRLLDLIKNVNQESATVGASRQTEHSEILIGNKNENNNDNQKLLTGFEAQNAGSDHYVGAATGSYANVHRHHHDESDIYSPHTREYHLGTMQHTREYHMGPGHHTREYHLGPGHTREYHMFDGTDDDDSDFHHYPHHEHNPHGADDDESDFHHHTNYGHNPHYMVHGPHHHYVVPGTNKHEDGSECHHDVKPEEVPTPRTTYRPTSSTSKPATDTGINIRNTFVDSNRRITGNDMRLETMDQTLGNRRQNTQELRETSLDSSTNRGTITNFDVNQQRQGQLFTNLDDVSQQRQGQVFTNTDNVRQMNSDTRRQGTATGTFFIQENSAQDMSRVNAQNDQLLAILENARRNQASSSVGSSTGVNSGSVSVGNVAPQRDISSGSQFSSSGFQTSQSQSDRNQNTTRTTSFVTQGNEEVEEDNGQQIQGFSTVTGANQLGSQQTLQNSRDEFTRLTTQQTSRDFLSSGSNTRASEAGRQDLSVAGLNQNEQTNGFSSNSGFRTSTFSQMSSGSQVQRGQIRGDQPLWNTNNEDSGQVIMPAFGGSDNQQATHRESSNYGGSYGSTYTSGSYGNSASSSNQNYETVSKDDTEDLGQQQVTPVFGGTRAQSSLLRNGRKEDTQQVEDIRQDLQQATIQNGANIPDVQALPNEETANVEETEPEQKFTTTEKPGFWKRFGNKVTNLFSKSS